MTKKHYTYRKKRFKFSKEKIEFIEKTGFWLDHKAAKALKVIRCHEKVNNGLNGLMGFWEDKDWPELVKGYRVVPHLNGYAVSKEGKVLRNRNGKVDEVNTTSYKEYLWCSIRIPWILLPSGNARSVSYLLHRLVAYCWVRNPDPGRYWLVRHLDDNKANCVPENLEWGDHYLNAKDALFNFKWANSKTCIVRNCNTHKVLVFSSVGQFARHIKSSHESILIHVKLNGNRPYKGMWEIKLGAISDIKDIVWEYDKPVGVRQTPYTYMVNSVEYYSVKSFVEAYDIKYIEGMPYSYYAEIFKNKFNIKIKVLDNKISNHAIECYDHKNKKVEAFDNINIASKSIGVSIGLIKKLLMKGPSFKKKGLSFRHKTNDKWPKAYTDITYRITEIEVTFEDGTLSKFKSIKDASRNIKVNEKAISRHIKSGKKYNGMFFRLGKNKIQ